MTQTTSLLANGMVEIAATMILLGGMIIVMLVIVCANNHCCQKMAFAKTRTTSLSATGTGEIVATMGTLAGTTNVQSASAWIQTRVPTQMQRATITATT